MIDSLNQWGQAWIGTLTWAVAQNTVFLGVVFLMLFALRRGAAKLLYTIALVGLAKLLVPPFLALPVPAAAVTALPAGEFSHLIPLAFLGGRPLTHAGSEPPLTAAGLLMALWGSLVGIQLSLSLIGSVRMFRRLRDAKPVDPAAIEDLLPTPSIRILKSARIQMPLTLAWSPRTIYVPQAWDRWSPGCRRMILHHEVAHLIRRDGLLQIVEVLAQALYFYHPLVHLLIRRLRRYREMACDDFAVRQDQASAITYSRTLIGIAESLVPRPPACDSVSALIGHRSELLRRVQYQLKGDTMQKPSQKKIGALAAILLILGLSFSWHRGEASAPSVAAAAGSPATTASAVRSSPPFARDPQTHAEPIALMISKDRQIRLDDQRVATTALPSLLAARVHDHPERFIVHIECEPDAPAKELFEVQRTLTELGLLRVRFVNQGGWQMPLVLPTEGLRARADSLPDEQVANLVIDASDRIRLDGQSIDARDVTAALRRRLNQNQHVVVRVHLDPENRCAIFFEIMSSVKQSAAPRVLIDIPVTNQ